MINFIIDVFLFFGLNLLFTLFLKLMLIAGAITSQVYNIILILFLVCSFMCIFIDLIRNIINKNKDGDNNE